MEPRALPALGARHRVPEILDNWGAKPLLPEQAYNLLEIVEDRYDAGSTLITSQVPVDRWYEITGIPKLADAVLDRLLHNAHRIEFAGESLRKAGSLGREGRLRGMIREPTDLDPDHLVFIDETAGTTAVAQCYGRAPSDKRCYIEMFDPGV